MDIRHQLAEEDEKEEEVDGNRDNEGQTESDTARPSEGFPRLRVTKEKLNQVGMPSIGRVSDLIQTVPRASACGSLIQITL